MTSIGAMLAFGTLVGMTHALEADHVAAVSTIVAADKGKGNALGHGLSWGLGHTITLLAFSGAALLLGSSIPKSMEDGFEVVVGLVLAGLGANLFWKMRRERVHFHGHSHGGTASHFHAHSHAGDPADHGTSKHHHVHRFSPRALLVGMVHGLAGSAALLVLAASQIRSLTTGVLYIAMFGFGSMIGMGLLSTAISLPLKLAEMRLTRMNRALQLGLASFSVFVGLSSVVRHLY